MIGIDTNLLVRILLKDSPKEYEDALSLILTAQKAGELFISSYVILETIWVLKTRKIPRKEIAETIIEFLSDHTIKISDRENLVLALDLYKNGKADFCDYLIMADSKYHGAKKFASFDRELLKEHDRVIHPSKYRKPQIHN